MSHSSAAKSVRKSLVRTRRLLRIVKGQGAISFLFANPDPKARRAIAENSSTPPSILKALATDVNQDVRVSVAENVNTPKSALLMVLRDQSPDVRYALAENAQMPAWGLGILCDDENPYVAYRAEATLQRSNGGNPINRRFAAKDR